MKTREDVTQWARENPAARLALDQRKLAVAALIERDGKIFLLCRGDSAMDEVGCLEGVGGRLESLEHDLETGLERELREETCDRSTITHPTSEVVPCGYRVRSFLGCDLLSFFNRDGAYHDWVVVTFLCGVLSGDPVVLEKGTHSAWGWFNINKLADWRPGTKRMVEVEAYTLKSSNLQRETKEVGLSPWVPVALKHYLVDVRP
jgi:hypothetical protein